MTASTALAFLAAIVSHPGALPSIALVAAWWIVIRLCRNSFWLLAITALPGTIAHELAHLAVALLTDARPVSLSVWPKRQGRVWQFGAIEMTNANLLNAAFVSMAPLLLLPLAWLLIELAGMYWAQARYSHSAGLAYLAATSLFAAIPSIDDFKLGWRSMMFYATLVGGIVAAAIYWKE